MKNTFFICFLFLFLSLSSFQMEANKPIGQDEENEDWDEGPNWTDEFNKLIYFYNHPIVNDTTIRVSNDLYKVSFKYYSLLDSAINLPKSYIWDDSIKKLVIHNFMVKLKIDKNGVEFFDRYIGKNDVIDNIKRKKEHEDLVKYGILLDFYFDGYKKMDKSFLFSGSYSIPMSDIGLTYEIVIDLKGNCRIHVNE